MGQQAVRLREVEPVAVYGELLRAIAEQVAELGAPHLDVQPVPSGLGQAGPLVEARDVVPDDRGERSHPFRAGEEEPVAPGVGRLLGARRDPGLGHPCQTGDPGGVGRARRGTDVQDRIAGPDRRRFQRRQPEQVGRAFP